MRSNHDLDSLDFRFHHIGHLVKDLSIAAENYVARFGYTLESHIIEDPIQTARVLFLRQPGAPFWLELVTPAGADSKLTNALRKGASLHHLCYEVADMDAACATLRAESMLLISEPVLAVAFPGRQIAWLMDSSGSLVELLEAGTGPLSLSSIAQIQSDV